LDDDENFFLGFDAFDQDQWKNALNKFLEEEPLPNVDGDSQYHNPQTLLQPGPVVTPSSQEEWVIWDIVDERVRGRGKQYLVRWSGWGDEENRWLPGREVANTEALDKWLAR